MDENGLITFKKEGSVTIRATVFGTLKEEATFSVTAPSEIKKIEDTIYTVWVMKGDDLAYPTDWKYEIVYENDAKGPVTDLIVGETSRSTKRLSRRTKSAITSSPQRLRRTANSTTRR